MTDNQDAAQLAELVQDCATLGIDRRVLLVQVPRRLGRPLRPGLRRLLDEQLEPFAMADRARLFRLPDEHRAVLFRGDSPGLDRAAADLGELLADPEEDATAVRLCRLPADAVLVQRFLARLGAVPANDRPPLAAPRPPGLAELARVEAALAQADLSRFMRRRGIFRPAPSGLAPAWEHRAPDLAELAESVAPGIDLGADAWLLRRLRRTLERRVLALLTDMQELRAARPFLFDLSPAGWEEPGFARFDAALPRALRGALGVRLALADLIEQPARFARARDDLLARGYALVLEIGSPALAAGFPPELTGVAITELAWPATGAALGHVLLSGVPDAAATRAAQARGAALLAGPGVDSS